VTIADDEVTYTARFFKPRREPELRVPRVRRA
jgi:hypothetical protein